MFTAFSGREKTFRKSGEILQEVGHEKTKLQNEWQESAIINFLMQKPFSAN